MTAGFVLWGIVVAAGIVEMGRYQQTAGEVAAAPPNWPRDTTIARARAGVTVVMFIHPRCPCTRASRSELAEISRTAPPTVRFVITSDAAEARRFGARTSGHVVVYDPTGELLFSGGITVSRGHVGANVGHQIVDTLVHGGTTRRTTTPVFGCALEAT
ncbi:MAG TPA: hypothetical protein VFQ65_07745 [Kofleriaceae bacterium]|nr:hypothetical protein [Kofleriaceae bacterium]